jgi:type I restriction enzyme S subunit
LIRSSSSSDTVAYFEGAFDPFYIVKKGDFLVGMDGDFNVRKWAGGDALLNQRVMRMRNWSAEVLPDYVALPLQFILDHLHGETSLTTVKHLSAKQVNGIEIPLPPLAEQRRIVAKVDELMALCDRLEGARARREAMRDRLTAATLARLTATETDAETFPTQARFALQTLPTLTTRPDQIKTLRQTILNLAVRGKLVAQDPTDEPAAELLKRIAKEVASKRKTMGLRPQDALPMVDESDTPFELPVGWAWARFPEVGVFARGKSKHRPRNDPALYLDGTIPFVQTGDVARSGGLITTHSSVYNETGLQQSMLWPVGTMCITIAANIADSGILTFDACFPDSVVGLVAASCFENGRFFEYFVRTAKARKI